MAKKIMSTGVGESKQFGGAENPDPAPQRHVNGRPIGAGPLDHLMGRPGNPDAEFGNLGESALMT